MNYRHLYLHFPFCETKCHYCDFYSLADGRFTEAEKAEFIQSLKSEVQLRQDEFSAKIETIFMGGGTPSMTDPEQVSQALEPLLSTTCFTDNYEWTMECNPSSIDADRLQRAHQMGVNRVSLGVQAWDNQLLKWLGRVHDRQQARRSLEIIFESPINNVSVDLMCGIPGQTLQHLEDAIDQAMRFPITHLSCYLLTLAPQHRLAKQLPDEEIQYQHLRFLSQKMRDSGFMHYEVSNFCRSGFAAKHNMAYWNQKSYLGLGPSAHSFSDSAHRRWKNFSSLKKYCHTLKNNELPIEWTEELKPLDRHLEKWLLGLRVDTGVPTEWFNTEGARSRLELYLEKRWMDKLPNGSIRLTPDGFPLLDQIVADFAHGTAMQSSV